MYKIGDIIKGKVTGIEDYGIFIYVDNNYTGLIHISEITSSFVSDINSFTEVGEEIYVEILDINETEKTLTLSIKNINYKYGSEKQIVKQTLKGFLPLKNSLNSWINTKIEEINKEKM